MTRKTSSPFVSSSFNPCSYEDNFYANVSKYNFLFHFLFIIFFILMLFCNGCSSDGVVCVDNNDLCIIGPTEMLPSENDVADLLSIMDARLLFLYPKKEGIRAVLKYVDISVEITGKKLLINCKKVEGSSKAFICDHGAEGVNINNSRIYIEYNKCFGASALAHELLHSWEFYVLGGAADNHHLPELFPPVGKRCTLSDKSIECKVIRTYRLRHKDVC